MSDDRLDEELRDLPREIPPERDLWPEIEARIGDARRGRIPGAAAARLRSRWTIGILAAAAGLSGIWAIGGLPGGAPGGGAPSTMPASGSPGGGTAATTPAAASPGVRTLPVFTTASLGLDQPALADARRAIENDPAASSSAGPLATLDSLVAEMEARLAAAPRDPRIARQLVDLHRTREGVVHQALRAMIDHDR